MSKKSKAQREKRKNKKSKIAKPSTGPTQFTLANPTARHAVLQSMVRQLPGEVKRGLASRCGSPEQVTFLLLADPSERFDGRMFQWPLFPEDNVAVFMTEGATDKVAFMVGTIRPTRNGSETQKGASQ